MRREGTYQCDFFGLAVFETEFCGCFDAGWAWVRFSIYYLRLFGEIHEIEILDLEGDP